MYCVYHRNEIGNESLKKGNMCVRDIKCVRVEECLVSGEKSNSLEEKRKRHMHMNNQHQSQHVLIRH